MKKSQQNQLKSSFLLLLGSLVWGLAFVAQSIASDTIDALTFNGIRFIIGGICLLPLMKGHNKLPGKIPANKLIGGVICGAALFLASTFQQLGITPPKTWEEMIAIIPLLQNNNMDIALPNSLPGLNLFLYQMGGDLYADNGKKIGLEDNTALAAFEYMCSFFSQYRAPYTFSFENRFRTGEMPIGILDYTAYTQLSVYASEIKGLWEFVPLPGYVTYAEDGTTIESINNSSVSTVTAMIMLTDRKRSEEQTKNAWTYMKWYVGASNQSAYANELTALLGTVSKHNTANVEALASLSWTTSEYKNLMQQFSNLSAVREYPGGYIITRYVSFAFLSVYNDNEDPVESILSYVNEINKEITRKRKEFGLTFTEVSNTFRDSEETD